MPTIKFNKPFEVLSQFTDVEKRRNLKDYIDLPGVYPVGRLDYRSEGLLLLSDDGRLIQQVADPRFEHPKTYYAQVEGILTTAAVQKLRQEIVLPRLQTRLVLAEIVEEPGLPPRPVPVRNYHPTSWLKIILNEGKKHQVRRMTAAVGYPTLRLVRVSIGQILLDDLQPGEWRRLNDAESQALLMSR